jgi:putative membrane protein
MSLLRRAVALGGGGTLALALAVTGANPAGAQPNDQDTTWMAAAHQSNLAEIAAGNAAVAQATTQEVRDLGQMFVDMHTQLDADLTAAAGDLGVELPPEPSTEQNEELAQVTSQSGEAFDTAWIAQQQGSHRTTLAATQTELAEGSDPTVLALAEAATPVVEQHLSELDALAGGAPSAVPGGSGGQAATSSSDSAARTAVPIALAGAAVVAGGLVIRQRSRQAA